MKRDAGSSFIELTSWLECKRKYDLMWSFNEKNIVESLTVRSVQAKWNLIISFMRTALRWRSSGAVRNRNG